MAHLEAASIPLGGGSHFLIIILAIRESITLEYRAAILTDIKKKLPETD